MTHTVTYVQIQDRVVIFRLQNIITNLKPIVIKHHKFCLVSENFSTFLWLRWRFIENHRIQSNANTWIVLQIATKNSFTWYIQRQKHWESVLKITNRWHWSLNDAVLIVIHVLWKPGFFPRNLDDSYCRHMTLGFATPDETNAWVKIILTKSQILRRIYGILY